jgi:phospholipid/cholesterol/gamma-HCH transport system substrate-binding protein
VSERQLQFRVGLFVITAMVATVVLVFQFGQIQSYLRPKYTILIHFKTAPGMSVATPVRRNGVMIGSVTSLQFDDKNGGLVARASIKDGVRLWPDGRVRLVSSLLGDQAIEFLPGRSDKALKSGDSVEAESAADPLSAVGRVEQNVTAAIDSFQQTSREWQMVGHNLNQLMDTNQGNLHTVVARAAETLSEVTRTMKSMNKTLEETGGLVADPQIQENLRRTLTTLPQLTAETQKTVVAMRSAVEKMDDNLRNLTSVTAPLSRRGVTLATHLENSLSNLEALTDELAQFAKVVNSQDGTMRKLASDPQLYLNLTRTAESAAMILRNLEPIMHDLRIFSDKVARHPELIGVSGALRGSSGLKDPEDADSRHSAASQRRTQQQ